MMLPYQPEKPAGSDRVSDVAALLPHLTPDFWELGWMGLLQHVPFYEYGVDPGAGEAALLLSRLGEFWGPTVLDANGDRVVTRGTLFRGGNPGDLYGPYLSQFLILAAEEAGESLPICLADAVAYVKARSLYQPFLDAAAVLQGFPDIWSQASLAEVQEEIADVATQALQLAGDRYRDDSRLHVVEISQERAEDEDRLKSQALTVVTQAAIAGAATAVLTARFGVDTAIEQPVIPAADGSGLEAYRSQGVGRLGALTLGGELEKLATNLVVARALPQMPWRRLFRETFELGEQVAIAVRNEA